MSQYQYVQADKPPTDWAKIILSIWAILAGVAIFVFFIWNLIYLLINTYAHITLLQLVNKLVHYNACSVHKCKITCACILFSRKYTTSILYST